MLKTKYKAIIYLRLSKEDGDKEESYSISNQRDLAMDFLARHPDIKLIDEKIDDGYTGSNFDRPHFQEMIDLITRGEINCVIVKDLSRFARDYIGSGYYLEKLFPSMGVRFISINDHIDSIIDDGANSKLIMAFKNVLNDSYIHDISVKIRSQFEIKRKKGEYIGAFVVYGYQKSPDNKHKLIIDKNAAEIVRNIFNQKMHGISASAIADKLNLHEVPSPAEYKKRCGSNFKANFQKKHEAKWTAKAVIRILTNEIYTGTLVQGKKTTVNYKVKKIIEKDPSEWSIIKNSHEAIISQEQFDTIQKLMERDTRIAPGQDEPYLFSGFLECADCNSPLVRRIAKSGDKTYVYYMCSTNKLGLGCTSHRISEKALYTSVLTAINIYCRNVHALSVKLSEIPYAFIEKEQLSRLEDAEKSKMSAMSDLEETIATIRKRQRDNLETKESADELCSDIESEIENIEHDLEKIASEKASVAEKYNKTTLWIDAISKSGNISELNRGVIANIVDKIYVYNDKRLEIKFRYETEYQQLSALEKMITTGGVK